MSQFPTVDPALAEEEARKQRAMALDLQFRRAERSPASAGRSWRRTPNCAARPPRTAWGCPFRTSRVLRTTTTAKSPAPSSKSANASPSCTWRRIRPPTAPESGAATGSCRSPEPNSAPAKAGTEELDEALSEHAGGAGDPRRRTRRRRPEELTVEPVGSATTRCCCPAPAATSNAVNAFADRQQHPHHARHDALRQRRRGTRPGHRPRARAQHPRPH